MAHIQLSMIRAEILRKKKKQERLHKVRLVEVKLGWGVYTWSVNACVRATNNPFVKCMEISESVHIGRVRQTRALAVFKRQAKLI